jgi:AcrR family transcriptional regulator
MGRPREHDEATRERLLEAAEHLSASRGWDAVTVRAVAESAGTSTRAVYALFASKEGLEQALHEAMFRRLRDLLKGREPAENPRTDLLNVSLAYRRWATERPERYALAVHRFVGQDGRARSEDGLAVSREALEELRGVVRRCHAAGAVAGGRDMEDVVTQLRALVHGLAEWENLGMLGADPERHWRITIGSVLDGYADMPAAVA